MDEVFKREAGHYTREFKKYMYMLNIKEKTLHSLRHTFSTNLYYLNVDDKKRKFYLGHASIVMTNDIYTSIDPTVTKDDIIKLYNNLYPNF